MAFSSFNVSFADDLGVEVVDVYVGPDRKRYVVHKNILTKQSEYFHKALTGSFKEAEENSIHLKEEDPEAVALLIGWLYCGVIPGTEQSMTSFVKSAFPISDTIQIPISEQGTLYPFAPTPFQSNALFGAHQLEYMQHICQQPEYVIFSPEELRLADYKLNHKYQGDGPANAAAPTAPPAQPAQNGQGLFGNLGIATQTSQYAQSLFGGFGTNTQPAHATSPFALPSHSSQVNQGLATGSSLFGGLSQAHAAQPNPPQQQNMPQVNQGQATGSSLFGGLSQAHAAQPHSPQQQNMPQVNQGQATGSSLFGGLSQAHAAQPHPPQHQNMPQVNQGQATGSSLFGGMSQAHAAQPSPPQHPNIFAHLNPSLLLSNQSPQPQNVSTGLNNTTSGPSNSSGFGNLGGLTQANPITNIFAHLSNPASGGLTSTTTPTAPAQTPFGQAPTPAGPTGSNLFGGSASLHQIQNPPAGVNNSTGHASASSAFATTQPSNNLFNTPQHTGGLFGTSQSSSVGLFGRNQNTGLFGAPPPNGGGHFGNPHNSLFPTAQPIPSTSPNHSIFGSHYSIFDTGAVLPPGATMITTRPQKPKTPGDFGYYPAIKHTKSPHQFIKGIPRSNPADERFIDLEKQQLALLNLCIMAETQCWSTLFNDAINAYIRGEHKLQRSLSLDFIDRIYTRTHVDSTLRAYVMDSISRLKMEGMEDISPYINMANKHDDFLADLLGKVMGSSAPLQDVTDKTVENYHMYGMDNEEDNNDNSEEL